MKKQEPEFLFAFDENQNLVNVNNLEREQKRKTIYTCIGCNSELIPALGKVKKKHFRHKHIVCSGETYFHRLAKETFYQTYKSCLENNEPFYIEIEQHYYCDKWLTLNNNVPCKINCEKKQQYDLTKYYNNIKMEQRVGNLKPDLLLIHKDENKPNEKIYVEIKVTHGISEEKQKSNEKIIEISISSEEDIRKIETKKLIEFDDRYSSDKKQLSELKVEFFNLNREIKKQNHFKCDCDNSLYYLLIIYENKNNNQILGKCGFDWVYSNDIADVINRVNIRHIIGYKIKDIEFEFEHGMQGKELFIRCIQKAYLSKIKLRNCFICRYAGDVIKKESKNPIFCKKSETECSSSNEAIDCQYFRIKKDINKNTEFWNELIIIK